MENASARVTGLLITLVLLTVLGPATARRTERVIRPLAVEPPALAVRPTDPAVPAHPGVPAEVMSRVPRFDPPPPALPVPLFRAPFGEHDATTLQVMRDCGMLAALYWKQTVDDGVVRFQEGATVQRGDIILMHFRPRFVDDFIAALQAIKAAGLTPALLENYLPGAG